MVGNGMWWLTYTITEFKRQRQEDFEFEDAFEEEFLQKNVFGQLDRLQGEGIICW